MKAAVIFILISFSLCSCGKKKTIQNTRFVGKNYVIEFPDSWEVNDSGMMGLDLIGLSLIENAADKFRENVNVVLENIPKTVSEKDYIELTQENMVTGFGVNPEENFAKVKVGSEEGYHMHYEAKMGAIEMDSDVYIVLKNGAAYVITCSNAKGKRDAFKSVMDSIIATFSIK